MNSSEVTPTVWNITRSTNSPIAKPAIAPAIEPASRPIDITTSGVTSAVTPNSEIWETSATWITTAKKPTTAIRRLSWMVLSVFIAASVPIADQSACGRVRICTRLRCWKLTSGVTGTC